MIFFFMHRLKTLPLHNLHVQRQSQCQLAVHFSLCKHKPSLALVYKHMNNMILLSWPVISSLTSTPPVSICTPNGDLYILTALKHVLFIALQTFVTKYTIHTFYSATCHLL